jgi:hypothetical protein
MNSSPSGFAPARVLIQACRQSTVPARVARHCLQKFWSGPVELDVGFIWLEDQHALLVHDGDEMMRKGRPAWWFKDVPQAFLPVRFLAPTLFGFSGRGVVMDPDIFALTDISPLFQRSMDGRSVLARRWGGRPNSSLMVLDCGRLEHWDWDHMLERLFAKQIDFQDWLDLKLEPPESVGVLDDDWNSIDRLNRKTKMLHLSNPRTQPWKTGLPLDDTALNNVRARDDKQIRGAFERHPSVAQERLFFRLLQSALAAGDLDRAELDESVQRSWVRPDVYEQMERAAGPLAAELLRPLWRAAVDGGRYVIGR